MIRIAITSEHTATVSPDTADAAHLEAEGGTDIQQRIIDYVTTIARRDGNDVKVHIDADQPVELVVSPHGDVSEAQPTEDEPSYVPKPEEPSAADPDNISASPEVELPATKEREESIRDKVPHEAPQDTQPTEYPSRRTLRDTTFLVTESRASPATKGWRGALNKLGARLDPSAAEQAERDDIHTVSQHWPGPRTVAVVNRKGGANKTPTVALLSAVFARYGGGPVVAWDN